MIILGIFTINQIRTGGDRRYLELMEQLAERGNKIFVIMNTYLDYTPKFFTKIEIPIKYIRRGFPPASFLFKKNVKKYFNFIVNSLNNSRINFIHIHGDIYLKAAIFLKKKLNTPLFYASRNDDIQRDNVIRKYDTLSIKDKLYYFILNKKYKSRERLISKYAEIITLQSCGDRDIFCKRNKIQISKSIIIPGNIGLPRCTEEWKNKNTSATVKNLLFVGAFSVSKGVLLIPPILAGLKERGYGNLHCTILGRNEFPKLNKAIEKYNLQDMVTLPGHSDPFPYLAKCDLFLYPALYDAYPDAVLEALHSGCPVLVSSVGGLPDMLHYPELLFNPNNINEAIDKIEKCILDTSFYSHIKKLCLERANFHHFNWPEQFEKAMTNFNV
ncbi:MAG: glycosyltransferase [Treponema sp.]|jgi:glycosyltransferase involved in cell wall biosynthesis|nr:glycosyltransferase [Treponema sp.]